jgi:ribosomal protein S18 acetylase RimI-like enzyme
VDGVVHYRKFRNTDPPGLVSVWNDVFAGRGAVRLPNSTPLERFIFAKPYFDPTGLIVAEIDGQCIGFGHAALVVGEAAGVICLVGVRPAFRRRGIGSELVRQCEEFLRQHGAVALYAGPHRPRDPFYLGLYGGSETPGILDTLTEAAPFLDRHQYRVCQVTRVFRRRVREPVRMSDPRQAARFELGVGVRKSLGSWERECVLSALEPLEFFLTAKGSGGHLAQSLAWEMDDFGSKWPAPAVGIVDLEVKPGERRKGIGRVFLALLMRALQEQYFETVELQVDEDNQAGLAFCRNVGFEECSCGRVYKKEPIV